MVPGVSSAARDHPSLLAVPPSEAQHYELAVTAASQGGSGVLRPERRAPTLNTARVIGLATGWVVEIG